MADKFPAMLSQKFAVKRVKEWPVAVEPKLDGIRCLIILKHIDDEYEIVTYSRAGNVFNSVEAIEDAIMDTFAETSWTEDMVFDGEVFCGDFSSTVSQIKRKSEQAKDAVLTIFDIIPLKEWADGKSELDFTDRRVMLAQFFDGKAKVENKIQMSKAVLADCIDEINSLHETAVDLGHEGVMVKPCHGEISHWVAKRSYGWMKLKTRHDIDLPILRGEEGEGRLEKTLGAIIVDFNGVEVNVGSGFSDEERTKLWRLHKSDKLKGLTAEVNYLAVTADKSLREPTFSCIRIDK